MELLNAYFDKLVFLKVEQKEGFTIYAASITSSYGDGKKTYALAFVPVHMAILDKGYLRDLHWQNFQTRVLSNGWKIQAQRWDMRQIKGLATPMFNLVERNEARTKYVCESAPLEMLLLHDPKKKSQYQYHNRINLLAALVTFKCILNFVEGHERQATHTPQQPMSPMRPSEGMGVHHQPYLNSIGQGRPDAKHRLDVSSIPISSLAVKMPQQQEAYTPASLPSNTSYVPRNEGTRYASNGANTQGYEFNGSTVTGGTGYTRLSLDLGVPQKQVEYDDEEPDEESERRPVQRVSRTSRIRRAPQPRQDEYQNSETDGASHRALQGEFQEDNGEVDDEFELL